MIYKGFRFGMLLQFAIGPVCLFIFQTASLKGFLVAETGVLGVLLIDGLFILAAILGLASIIERKNIKIFLKLFGAIVLFLFGASTILGVFHIEILPALSLQNTSGSNSVFFRAVLLTGSNPLTILFWAGVFSAKIADENMERKDISAFGFGALLSTVFFLSLVAIIGSITNTLFPPVFLSILNGLVGILLIYFSMHMIVKKA